MHVSINVFDVRSVNLNGTSNTTLNDALVAGGDVTEFKISPNSARVVYRADRETNGIFELYSVAIGGGATSEVSGELPSSADVQNDFVIAPDSTSLIYRADQNVDEQFEFYLNGL